MHVAHAYYLIRAEDVAGKFEECRLTVVELYVFSKLLRILATLPVSLVTAERSFSTLHRLRTWLRANMGEERLTDLALLSVHRDVLINLEAIIVRFSRTRCRQEFLL